ncbi:hypothetical protein PoB_001641300 [Plakobranchus ocellatus]|uniref:Uncharacterized protein n=1 Tax=Plakobranchus ocellatus TaxID=259542 RepID=A0AAV3Z5G4_9GAST|nr:hypothetical protein PoB_001641300 [Plakobranchus ocellatus]
MTQLDRFEIKSRSPSVLISNYVENQSIGSGGTGERERERERERQQNMDGNHSTSTSPRILQVVQGEKNKAPNIAGDGKVSGYGGGEDGGDGGDVHTVGASSRERKTGLEVRTGETRG